MTALNTFTKCCTGAALTGPRGMMIILLNTTFIAIKSAVIASFLDFI